MFRLISDTIRSTKNIRLPVSVAIIISQLFTGCAVEPYSFSPGDVSTETVKLAQGETQFERGEPYWLLDGLGHYLFSLPTKLILLNWSMENHDISPGTEAAMSEYLAKNNLSDVKVRLNQYSPGDEWGRLVDNRSVGWGWRYTVGILGWLSYTIFPGRLFGGDNYNPYTNTISLYSDHAAVALHEAGHSKDFALTEWKGSYAFLGLIPFSSLWFEAQATGDAVGYMRLENQRCREKDGYKVLYPAYATYIGGELTQFISIFNPIDSVLALAAVIPAHVVGRIEADQVEGCDEDVEVDHQEVEQTQPDGAASTESCDDESEPGKSSSEIPQASK